MLNKLFSAIKIGNVKVVKQLLDRGVDPNGCLDEDQVTPLHMAAQINSVPARKITHLLLAKGANPFAETSDGLKPIDIAQMHHNEALVLVLKTTESS